MQVPANQSVCRWVGAVEPKPQQPSATINGIDSSVARDIRQCELRAACEEFERVKKEGNKAIVQESPSERPRKHLASPSPGQCRLYLIFGIPHL